MVAFDALEDIFKHVSEYSDCSRAALTLATASGFLFLTYLTLALLYHIIQALRLYCFAQMSCCKTSYAEKYGKWAIVTGATDGIGLAMAKELARRGQSIIIVGRNDQKLADSKEQVEREGGDEIEVMTVKIDLSDSSRENYQNVAQFIDPDNRDIGILINNAGYFLPELKNFHTSDESDFLRLVNVNVLGVLNFSHMILPGMIKRERGLIVNVSSTVGSMSSPYLNVYGPTKAFIDRFTSNLAQEYATFPIDFINLTPGGVQTKIFQDVNDQPWIHKASHLVPSPDNYARTAINAFSTRINQYCGCFGHSYSNAIIKVLQQFGLSTYFMQAAFRMSSSKFKPSIYNPKKDKLLNQSTQEGDVNQTTST